MNKNWLSVVIVSYNCHDMLRNCLESIRNARLPFQYEVIVVDNASSDGGPDAIAADFPEVALIRNTENVGFARANNQGIRQAAGEYVLLLNNDTVVKEGTIEAMMGHLGRDGSLGAVGCGLEGADGRLQVSFGGMLNFHNEFFQKYFSLAVLRLRKKLFKLRVSHPHWVSGAFLMARRQTLLDVGLLDEGFFMYTEEVDLCERIRKRGLRVRYDPSWRIVHYGGKSTETNRLKASNEFRRSQLYFYSKHYGVLWARLLKAYLVVKTGFSYVVARLRRESPSQLELRRGVVLTVWRYPIASRGGLGHGPSPVD